MADIDAKWIRYGVWDRWRELTRFRLASEMALESYGKYVDGFPVSSESPLVISDPAGSKFRCDLNEFRAVLSDREHLYRVLMPSYAALIENLGMEIVAWLLAAGVERKSFPGIDKDASPEDAAEGWIGGTSIDIWGRYLLRIGGRDWTTLDGGIDRLMRTIVVRHHCAHGFTTLTDRGVTRLRQVLGEDADIPSVGDPIAMDRPTFLSHVATLKSFGRAIASCAAQVEPVRKGGAS